MSFLKRLFRTRPEPREQLRPLWHRTVELARLEHWYADCGVADTVEGRFDMVTNVLSLVLLRMEGEPPLAPSSALLTELFVEDMDGQLRESGVGDVVVGKHVGRLISTLGGRLGAYRDTRENSENFAAAIARNTSLVENGSATCVADGLLGLGQTLAETSGDALLRGEVRT